MAAIAYLTEPPSTADLVIVGGGVVGASSAFYASRAGMDVVLVERRSALATLTTPASTGAFRLQFDNEEEYRLIGRSVETFLNFADITQQLEYDLAIRQQGYLWVATEAETAERQTHLVQRQRSWGLEDVELVDGDEARRRWPYLAPDILQARFRGEDGFLDPRALTFGMAAGSTASVVLDCEAVGFLGHADRVTGVRTTRGDISSARVVIAAGPFSGVVAELAGLSPPLTTVARHKVIAPEVEPVPADAPMTIDEETGAHWRPALAGAFLLFTDPLTPPSPPTEDVPPDHRQAFRLLHPDSSVSAARIAPFWAEVWERGAFQWLMQSGQYTMTPDHRPLIGATNVDGLYLHTGYSGHGIMGSAAGSEHLVDLLTEKVSEDDNPFRTNRRFVRRDRDIL